MKRGDLVLIKHRSFRSDIPEDILSTLEDPETIVGVVLKVSNYIFYPILVFDGLGRDGSSWYSVDDLILLSGNIFE